MKYLPIILILISIVKSIYAEPFDEDWSPKYSPNIEKSGISNSAAAGSIVNINVTTNRILKINPELFGNNAAVWDKDTGLLNSTMKDRLKQVNIPILRFPGGSTSDHYHWNGIYPPYAVSKGWDNMSKIWAVDTDEFLQLCEELGIPQKIFTVNHGYCYYNTTATDGAVSNATKLAADWVEYCNMPTNWGNLNGGTNWAKKRAENGHPEPYNVKYWEVGNEVYGHWEVGHEPDGSIYGQHYVAFYDAMKAVDPSIYIGLVINPDDTNWSAAALSAQGVAQRVDFLICHEYFLWVKPDKTEEQILASASEINDDKNYLDSLVQNYTTRSDIKYDMTEYNTCLPATNWHTVRLTAGLFITKVIGMMITNGFNAANLWDVQNGWGGEGTHAFTSKNQPDVTDYTPYPHYYPFFFYTRNFGSWLIPSSSDNSKVIVFASKFDDDNLGVIIVNEDPTNHTVKINLNNTDAKAEINSWVLTGDSLLSTDISLNGQKSGSGYGGPPVESVSPYYDGYDNVTPLSMNIEKYSVTSLFVKFVSTIATNTALYFNPALPSQVEMNDTFHVRVEVNAKKAINNVVLTLNLSPQFSLLSGASPTNLGSMSSNEIKYVTWNVKATSAGGGTISVSMTNSYDSTNISDNVEVIQYQYTIIDDYEQYTNYTVSTNPYDPGDLEDNYLGGYWCCYDDHDESFSSAQHSKTIKLAILPNAAEGIKCMQTAFTLGVSSASNNEWGCWELDTTLSPNGSEQNLTSKTLSFYIKGSENFSTSVQLVPSDTKANAKYGYNLYGATVNVTTNWQNVVLPIDDNTFFQEEFGSNVSFSSAVTEVVGFAWKKGTPTSGSRHYYELYLDEVSFLNTTTNGGSSGNTSPIISGISAFQTNDGSGKVIINYTGTDAENDTCTYVKAEYSTNNSTWYAMTVASNDTRHNSEPLGFTSSGASLNFVWDSLAGVYDGTVWVRLQVNDGTNNSSIVSSSSFVVDNENPTIPSLSTPASNSVGNNTAVTFTWNASSDGSGIDHYVIEVSTNSAFGNIEATATPSGTSQTFTLTEGTNYWRVRAYDAYGHVSANSVVWSVSIDTNQIIPTLLSPTTNTISSNTKPTFYWSSESGISSNQIVITTNGVAINITLSSNETNYSVTNFALPEGTNSWKVRVKTSTGWQAFSASYTYIVDTTAPGTVSNPTPADNAVVGTNNVTLSWTPATDANGIDHYNVVINGVTNSVTSTNYTVNNLSETSYTWKVAAADKAGNVGNYVTSHFTVKIEQALELPKNTFTVIPNPLFKDEIMDITYGADAGAEVKFEVYTIVGSLVKTIQPNTSTQTAIWYGKNSDGKEVASGIYLMIMRVNDKMVYHPIKVGYVGRHK